MSKEFHPCIFVKKTKKQFFHQMLYTGRGMEIRCHYCGLEYYSIKEYWEAATRYYTDYQI